eukprot:991235_1
MVVSVCSVRLFCSLRFHTDFTELPKILLRINKDEFTMSGQPQEQLTQGQINQRLFERMEKVEVEIVKEGANNLSTGQSRLMQYAEFILDRFTGEQEGVPFKIAILRQISSPAAIVAMNSGRAAHTAQHFMAEGIQLLLASGEFSGSVLPRTEFDIFVLGVASSGKTVEDHAHAFSFIAQTLVAANGVPNEFQIKNVHTLMNIFYGYLTHRVVLGMVSDATRKLGLATHWIADMVKVEFDTLYAQRHPLVWAAVNFDEKENDDSTHLVIYMAREAAKDHKGKLGIVYIDGMGDNLWTCGNYGNRSDSC